MRTKRKISKHLLMKDNGKLVPFNPKQPLELYTSTTYYYFTDEIALFCKLNEGVHTEGLYPTLTACGEAIGKTSARASQLYTDGKIKCVKIWSEGFEIKPNEIFKPLANGYYLSNHGRILRINKSKGARNHYKIIKPRRTMGNHLQLSGDVTRAANLRTSLIAPTVLEMFVEPKPTPDAVCIHADGNTMNNYVKNLYWGTRVDAAQNREKFGNGHHDSKDKVPIVIVSDSRTHRLEPYIGKRFDSICDAAREIGISPMCIRQYIKSGKINREQ